MRQEMLPEAVAELRDEAFYYESRSTGVGLRFADEVAGVLAWIEANPEVPRLRARGYRRVNLKRFPYFVAYMIHDGRIWILAVSHHSRRPEHWIQRREQLG